MKGEASFLKEDWFWLGSWFSWFTYKEFVYYYFAYDFLFLHFGDLGIANVGLAISSLGLGH